MAAREIIWSREATVDLFTILDYYKNKNGSAEYSDQLNSRVNQCLLQIAKHPRRGNETRLPSVRTINSEDCNIVYEVFDNQIMVVMLCDHTRGNEDNCW